MPIWLDKVEIDVPVILKFIDISNLSNTLFIHTDLEKVSFKKVRFRKAQNLFFNRELSGL